MKDSTNRRHEAERCVVRLCAFLALAGCVQDTETQRFNYATLPVVATSGLPCERVTEPPTVCEWAQRQDAIVMAEILELRPGTLVAASDGSPMSADKCELASKSLRLTVRVHEVLASAHEHLAAGDELTIHVGARSRKRWYPRPIAQGEEVVWLPSAPDAYRPLARGRVAGFSLRWVEQVEGWTLMRQLPFTVSQSSHVRFAQGQRCTYRWPQPDTALTLDDLRIELSYCEIGSAELPKKAAALFGWLGECVDTADLPH